MFLFYAADVPDAPVNVTATAGARAATVEWDAPLNDGGEAITGFEVTTIRNGVTQAVVVEADASRTSVKVSSLDVGVSYTFTVAAKNSLGTGTGSSASNTVVPLRTYPFVIS